MRTPRSRFKYPRHCLPGQSRQRGNLSHSVRRGIAGWPNRSIRPVARPGYPRMWAYERHFSSRFQGSPLPRSGYPRNMGGWK